MKVFRTVIDYADAAFDIIFLSAAVFIIFFQGIIINSLLKEKLEKAFADAYPGSELRINQISYSIWTNQARLDSVFISSADPGLSCSIPAFRIKGINWVEYIREERFSENVMANAVMEIERLSINIYNTGYKVLLRNLYVSVPDSEMKVSGLVYRPLASDTKFFAKSKFRKTRLRMSIPEINITGISFPDILSGKKYHSHFIQVNRASVDILLNKEKPAGKITSKPLMPNEIFSLIKDIINIDSLRIKNAKLRYKERFESGGKPGILTFDKIRLTAAKIGNNTLEKTPATIYASADFMKEGIMNLYMTLSLSSKNFSVNYSGTLGGMDLKKLNIYLEEAEELRIKSGMLSKAGFDISLSADRALGNVKALYKDFSIALIDSITGSESDINEKIPTAIANLVKIRKNNISGESDSIKSGTVKYSRRYNDTFIQYLWFSLRSGIGDIVGFKN